MQEIFVGTKSIHNFAFELPFEADLDLNTPFIKGLDKSIKNCWHFYTDGNSVDLLFEDKADFTDAMNRIFVVSQEFEIIILAFVLMDTHVHFILYGQYSSCNLFVHEFIRRTSMYISAKRQVKNRLSEIKISHQPVTTDKYLKTAICYVIKNPFSAGLPFKITDYPWGSNNLYFRPETYWTTPDWNNTSKILSTLESFSKRYQNKFLKTRNCNVRNATIIGDIVFPGEYTAFEIVERLFRSHKSFTYFLLKTKDEEVESVGGETACLSIPIHELLQKRNEICMEQFGVMSIRTLTANQRILLAKMLRSRYNSSVKQIARVCGLIYEEAKKFII